MMRLWVSLASPLLILTIGGCGGGSGPTSGSGGGSSNAPTLTGIAPSSVLKGAPSLQLLAFGSKFGSNPTLQWNGADLLTQCVNGNLTPIVCSGATELEATVPASDVAATGTAKITVKDENAGGGTSNSLSFNIAAPSSSPATWVRLVPGISAANEMVWDAQRKKLLLSVSSYDPTIPDTIAVVDPASASVTATAKVPASSNPNLISLSADDNYLWVGLDGSSSVERLLLPGLSSDITIPLPLYEGTSQTVLSMQAAPVNPHTLALIPQNINTGPVGNGVFIYDDTVPRANSVPGYSAKGPTLSWLQWGKDDSVLYGNQFETIDQGGIATMSVNTSGVTLENYNGGLAIQPYKTHFEPANGLLYSYDVVYDPVKLSLVGSFDLPFGRSTCTDDPGLNRYYCVSVYSQGGTDILAVELWVFDLTSYALIDRVYYGTTSQYSTSSSIGGGPVQLVRWGNAGLALLSSADSYAHKGSLYLIDGPAVNPNAAPDAASGTPVTNAYAWMSSMNPQSAPSSSTYVTVDIKGQGFTPDSTACWSCNAIQYRFLPTDYVSPTELSVTMPVSSLPTDQALEISVFDPSTSLFSSNALTFTIQPGSSTTQVTPINLCGLSMAWDANTQLLYVGTADYDGFYPNAVVAVDPEKGTISKAQTVGATPIFLSDSAGGQFLYAAYGNSTNLTQLSLPSLSVTATGVFSNPPNTWYPGDMKAAPDDPHTVAATLLMPGFKPEALGGVVVYDDGVPRPQTLGGWGAQTVPAFFDTLAWGPSNTVLGAAGALWDAGGGPLYSLSVDSSGVSYLSSGSSVFSNNGYIHSDFGTGLLYSDAGVVADPQTGSIVGNYNASGLVAPDSSLNRVFILGQTSAQAGTQNFTIQSFDQKSFTLVSSITLNALSGSPVELVRWGTSGLAVLTAGGEPDVVENGLGMLYLISDTTFVSNEKATPATRSSSELVQHRWQQLPKRQMLNNIHQKLRTARNLSAGSHL